MRVSSDDRAGVFTSTTHWLNWNIKGIYKLMTFPTSSHTERPPATTLEPDGPSAHAVYEVVVSSAIRQQHRRYWSDASWKNETVKAAFGIVLRPVHRCWEQIGADLSPTRSALHSQPRPQPKARPHHIHLLKPQSYAFISYLEIVTCGSSHLFSGLLRAGPRWSSITRRLFHPHAAYGAWQRRPGTSITAASTLRSSGPGWSSDRATPRPTVTDFWTKDTDAAASVCCCSRWEGARLNQTLVDS